MAVPSRLDVNLSAVTPLFIGGVDGNQRAELRSPSIKGLLRYWYRALDADYRRHEERFFGSTSAGQSACLLRIDRWQAGQEIWDEPRYKRLINQGGFQRGSGKEAKNGLIYLGYSLKLKPNDRKALPADTSFMLTIQPRPGVDGGPVRRAWIGALWLLVHIGGIGARSRRGLGSLRIESWSGWSECQDLPLACAADTPDEWKERFEAGLGTLREWFPKKPPADHTVLARGARFLILAKGSKTWEVALDHAGLLLQAFRQRREPDYTTIKAHLAKKHEESLAHNGMMPSDVTPHYLNRGPERAGFGLPLAFRYKSLEYPRPQPRKPGEKVTKETPNITFVGVDHDRMASPLFIRIVKLGNAFHSLFAHLPAPALPEGEKLKDQSDQKGLHPWPWHPKAEAIIDLFLNEKVRPGAVEVSL